jgi:RNA polymerase sigma-70 factor (ECF subfamily)
MNFETHMVSLLPNLRAFARSLSGNSSNADDLVQDTVLKAWEHKGKFQEGSNMKAWLFTILRNVYISDRRKKKHEIADSDGFLSNAVPTPSTQEDHIRMLELSQAWDHLPADQRTTLALVAIEGIDYEDAALMLNCAVGTAKSRANRARNTLATILGEPLPNTAVDAELDRVAESLCNTEAEEIPSILSDDL